MECPWCRRSVTVTERFCWSERRFGPRPALEAECLYCRSLFWIWNIRGAAQIILAEATVGMKSAEAIQALIFKTARASRNPRADAS